MLHSASKQILSVPTANCHASCIARINGETWLTWFGGTREGHDDVKIYVSRCTQNGWTQPVRICADEETAHWNPVLLPRGEGADLFFRLGKTITGWKTMRVRLGAYAHPISEIHELVSGDVGGRGPVRSKCLTLSDGRILAPTSLETAEPERWSNAVCAKDIFHLPEQDPPLRWKPFVDISEDGGETFTRACPVPLKKAASEQDFSLRPEKSAEYSALPLIPCLVRGLGAIQPALWQTKDGCLHMLLRSSEGFLLRSDSDDGETWSTACMTAIPNNNSGLDLVHLEDGRLLLCMNPVSGDWAARTPLSLYLSTDEGNTFKPLMTLEMNEGEYSYPSLASEGNKIFLSYTWKREKIAVWTIELEPLKR